MLPLKYPFDRVNGFVQLTDGNGDIFVTDMQRTGNEVYDALKYSGAFLILAHRLVNETN